MPNQITDLFQCVVGLSTHMVEKDLLKLFKKCCPTRDSLPIKGVCKRRGGNVGFLQFSDRDQLLEFQELFTNEIGPQNPKIKIKEVTKRMSVNEFKAVKTEEEQK